MSDNKQLSVYTWVSSLPLPLSYSGKLMLIAFIGTHIPLISIGIYTAVNSQLENLAVVLVLLLLATLAGTGVTLFLIHKILSPIKATANSLERYKQRRELPDLPENFTDDAGILMSITQSSLEQLESMFVMKDNLISIISHDTRTPIGSISMSCDLIEMQLETVNPDTEDIYQLIQIIKQSNKNQDDTIKNMVALTRLDENNFDLEIEEVNADDLSANIKKSFELYFERKEIDFEIVIDSDLKSLYIDKQKITGALNNLIQNAIKFTPKGGRVTFSIQKEESGAVILSVKDNGKGIPEDKKKELFQAHSFSTDGTSGEKGTGLGLWIVNMFTRMHKGYVDVESTIGGGSEFKIVLPQEEAAAANKII